jgi:hypothetical protein
LRNSLIDSQPLVWSSTAFRPKTSALPERIEQFPPEKNEVRAADWKVGLVAKV